MSGVLDFSSFDALTFDCYGTLIDWERGILAALEPVLHRHGCTVSDEELLEAYARHEAELEAGDYLPYREVVSRALHVLCADLRIEATDDEATAFALAVGDWPAFPDAPAALRRLGKRFRLGVITNCDDDLFALSNRRLGVTFDWIVTAEQARSYKPSHTPFEVALATIGLPSERVLHVAQSLYHDHVPAQELGLTTVWIDRRAGRTGFGATPLAEATPDLTVADLRTFADLAVGPDTSA